MSLVFALLALCIPIPIWSQISYYYIQISLSAFEYLFSEFSPEIPTTTNTFKDHCILSLMHCLLQMFKVNTP